MLEEHTILIEYLKEHYVQARQHETLRTTCTTFLTAASGVILGLQSKGTDSISGLMVGSLILLIGWANHQINRSHFLGNRFHRTIARYARSELERLPQWTVMTPTQCREKAYRDLNMEDDKIESVGAFVQRSIQRIPIGVMFIGASIALYDLIDRTTQKSLVHLVWLMGEHFQDIPH